jgi:hypothetical protein
MRCSTCKPTLTALPGDWLLGLLSGLMTALLCLLFVTLRQYVVPSCVDDSAKSHGAP